MTAYVKGTCTFMCPAKERTLREKENLLHLLELPPGTKFRPPPKADPELTVKSFSRSAAGQQAPRPEDLRPPHVLHKTIAHLLSSPQVHRSNLDWCMVYDFVFDRLRAVRQDLVIQALHSDDSIAILEPIVRFHCYAGYKLCEEPMSKFDPAINKTHLLECLKRLLVLYDEQGDCKKNGRAEMEALYLLMTLGNAEGLTRGLRLPHQVRRHDLIQMSLKISLAMWNGNYIRVGALVPILPPLLMCAVAQQMPTVRKYAFQVMSHAYNSRNLTFPLEHLMYLLLYKSEKQAVSDCEACGIEVDKGAVKFRKTDFKTDSKLLTWKISCVDDAMEFMKLSDLLTPCGVKS